MASIYFEHQCKFILLRYEDFLEDKVGSIRFIAMSCNHKVINDITPYVDVQYQAASDKRVDIRTFFGERNLSKIDTICAEYKGLLYYT